MSIRTPSRSIFRPEQRVDRAIFHEHKVLIERIDRRNVLRGTLSLGALTLLTGCNVTESDQVQTVLRAVSAWNDRVQELIFRPNHLAPTYPESRVAKPPRSTPTIASTRWSRSTVRAGGSSCQANRRQAPVDGDGLPRASAAGDDHQAHMRRGLGLYRAVVGREPAAVSRTRRRRPQGKVRRVSLCGRLHREPRHGHRAASADDPGDQIRQGADYRPVRISLRLRTATKLGFKNAKWVTAIEVTNDWSETYWSKRGENWFAGIQTQ